MAAPALGDGLKGGDLLSRRQQNLNVWLFRFLRLLLDLRGSMGYRLASIVGFSMVLSVCGFMRAKTRRIREVQLAAREEWRRHIDLSAIQAVLLSAERFRELGRVEKRTLFTKSITEVFQNSYIRETIVEAALAATQSGDPFLVKRLELADKWQVLTECQNHISSLFAPHHLFFNEASIEQSCYRSSWYCFTLTCHQTEGAGRFFITPHKPLKKGDDVGMMRIRIVMASEKELRDIANGFIDAEGVGFFSRRHQIRWQVLEHFAALFRHQLRTDDDEDSQSTPSTLSLSPSRERITSLLGRPLSQARCISMESMCRRTDSQDSNDERDQNTFLRIHVPFPASNPHHPAELRRLTRQISCEIDPLTATDFVFTE
eukprot:gnl/TRDRNA2_/TRDRNA2_136591_c0_seq2.p1 gnl/TRDRNA2_/TRDRNA2_136591_c0~~gnl/TRDRNA2_/TRDRNA2_136591_c0_seq2.p1  ORF type:complete len:392 (+),score=55.08 gnl/TRDRNA2_/TRDRNA2_136591_c0_seq2:58-1176(+)